MKPPKNRTKAASLSSIRAGGAPSDITAYKRTEEALRELQALTNAIVDSTSDMIWSVDPVSFKLLTFNRSLSNYFLQWCGIHLQTGTGPEDHFPSEELVNRWRGLYQRALSEGLYTTDYKVTAGSNTLQLTFHLLKRDGKAFAISVFGKNITERKRAEEALRRQAAFDELMTKILGRFATCAWSEVDSSVVDALQAMAEFIGVDHAYVIMFSAGRSTWSATHEWCGPNVPPRLQDYQNIRLGTQSWSERRLLADEIIRLNSPDELPPEASAERQHYEAEGVFSALDVPIKVAAGVIKGCVGFHSNTRPIAWSDTHVSHVRMLGDAIASVIERKRAEEALRQSEQRYKDFISHSNEGVWRVEYEQPIPIDLQPEEAVRRVYQYGYIAECNESQAHNMGFSTAKDVIGVRLGEVFPTSDEERNAALRAAARGGWQNRTVEFRSRDMTGALKHLLRTEIPIVQNGMLVRVWGITRDITELRQAEEALRESEARLRLVVSQLPAIVWSTDKEMRFTSNMGAGLRTLGVESNQLVGRSVNEYVLGFGAQPDRPDHRRALAGESLSYEVVIEGRDYDVDVEPLRNAAVEITGTVGIALDVTARKRAETALRESEERFRATFENAGVGMALVDLQGRPVKSNPAFRQMLGYSEEELSRMAFTEFTHPDDRELDWGLYSELVAGKGDKYEIEKRYLQKGGGVVWGQLTVSLVRGRHGRPVYAVGMVQDITKRKRAEEERQRSFEQLRALAGRLQSIREEERKRVAREIHDQLGQALTAIKIDLSSWVRELPAEDKLPSKRSAAILKLVDESIHTVRRISTELRPGMLDDLGLVATLEWAGEDFQARTGTTCRLDLPHEDIAVDPEWATAIFRIFQETLTNVARHADASAVEVRLAKENGDLTLEVHDNGKGIPSDKIMNIKSLGILGMRERAMLLGGELSISSPPGSGTTVRVRIPDPRRP